MIKLNQTPKIKLKRKEKELEKNSKQMIKSKQLMFKHKLKRRK